jgi:homoserine kinase type II
MFATLDLPQQLLHQDYGPGNILMDGDRVTAILDFEFVGLDWRLFDLVVALSWWPVRKMGTGEEWELIDAFARTYVKYVPLNPAELRALPAALRMRDTTSLVYRFGRHLAGLETMETVRDRVQHSIWREAWLQENAEKLVEHALLW